MKKTTSQNKKSTATLKDKCRCDFHDLCGKLESWIKDAKTKYDQADDKTKKTVLAGMAGAAALIAGAISYKRAKKKKDK